MTDLASPRDVLEFWNDAGPGRWFAKDDDFDELVRRGFLTTYEQAARGALDAWADTADGALALAIVLDQLPRNMFRRDPKTWATDPAALAVATTAIDRGFDLEVDSALRRFFYVPFMHAEDIEAQERSRRLHQALGDQKTMDWAQHHHDIVARFGRFPHRNRILGRVSTPEELAFLQASDFRG